jgi:DeoR family glycerol-3-phosphate regulon repressor
LNSNPRQLRLLDAVRARQSATVDELADALGVTVQTVRRDLQRFAGEGLLARFHGGARLPHSTVENIAYPQRATLEAEGKERIAQAVAAQVPNGSSLILNIGTTVEAIARALLRHRGLQVITNNLNVANILSGSEDCEIVIAGGAVRSRDRAIVGEATIAFMRQFKVDIAIVGVSSIEPDGSLRDFDLREVKVSQTIMAQAREVWLAVDATKFGRLAMVEVGRLAQVDRLFTERDPPPPFPQLLDEAKVRCEIARAPAPVPEEHA